MTERIAETQENPETGKNPKTPGNRYNLDLSTENLERLKASLISASLRGDRETTKHINSVIREIEAKRKKLGIE